MSSCEHCGESHRSTNRFCSKTGKLMASRIFAKGELLEGKYRVSRTLGVGGMGAVFEARHTLLDKQVAIKVLLPGQVDEDGNMTARFVREARAASAIGHRNIATVTDMGWTDEGSLFVVMEYLDGETFVDLTDEDEELTCAHACRLVLQVLLGLEAVHRNGIIHRDLKPENLMLVTDDEGEEVVKILDFGISKIVSDEEKLNLTATGMVMGTPQYMSPEQARCLPDIDHRTDIYSVGAILYLLITGQPPIQEETISAQIVATVEGNIDPPSSHNPDVPRELDRIVMKALARRPEERYPDARSFSLALKPHLAERPAEAGLDFDLNVNDESAKIFFQLSDSAMVSLDQIDEEQGAAGGEEFDEDDSQFGEFDIASFSRSPGGPDSDSDSSATRHKHVTRRRIQTGKQDKVDEIGNTMAADSGVIRGGAAGGEGEGEGEATVEPLDAEPETSRILEELDLGSLTPIDHRDAETTVKQHEPEASVLGMLDADALTPIDQRDENPVDQPAAADGTPGQRRSGPPEPTDEAPLEPPPEPRPAAKRQRPAPRDPLRGKPQPAASAVRSDHQDQQTARLKPPHEAPEPDPFAPPAADSWDGPLETDDEASLDRQGMLMGSPGAAREASEAQFAQAPPAPAATLAPAMDRPTRNTARTGSPYGHARRSGEARAPASRNKRIALAVVLLVVVGWIVHSAVKEPDRVSIRLNVLPPWAAVQLDGQAVTTNPLVLPQSEQPRRLEAAALGHQKGVVTFVPDRDQTVRISLEPSGDGGAKPPR